MSTTRTRTARTTRKPAVHDEPAVQDVDVRPDEQPSTEQQSLSQSTDEHTEREVAPSSTVAPIEPPAGARGFDLAAPVEFAGIEWTPADGDPFASPIGAALAAEMAGAA
jgi:hypothetical protein